ncbi:MAG: hypothetical protein QXT67_02460 [Candidatus Bathyarchaeia archaeon]
MRHYIYEESNKLLGTISDIIMDMSKGADQTILTGLLKGAISQYSAIWN